VYRINGVK